MLSVVTPEQTTNDLRLDLDQLVREGARRMLAAALEAEVDDYLAAHQAERDAHGRRLVVRNGHARERQVVTAAGAVTVRAPRVDDRRVDPVTGGRVRFVSRLLDPAEPHAPGDSECPAASRRHTVTWVTAGHGVPGRLVCCW
jgi:hypothetical protein